jgi:succinoglycan biosynthesis transport protein ExoP
MELKDFAATAWKRRWLVLFVFVLTTALSAALAFTQPKRFESTTTLALTPNASGDQGYLSPDALAATLGTYAQTAKSEVNLERARRLRGGPLPGSVDTSIEQGTGILRVSSQASSPQAAADTAQAAALAFVGSLPRDELVVARIIDPAQPESTPIQPRPPLITAVGAFLGLVAGIFLAFALQHFRRRLSTADDIAEFTSAPVIGRLPRFRALQRGASRIVWGDPKVAGLQEAFRSLRTNLEFLADTSREPVLLVTSPQAGQGKSTVVANLGIGMAQLGIPTVIVDGDLRRPQQHRIFELGNDVGLSNLMSRARSEPEPLPTAYENLSVLPSGPIPPDPTEMLHIRFAPVIEKLRSTGALVLVDSSPVLPVDDARLMAPHVDGVVLVLAAGAEKPAALQRMLEKLSLVGARVLGVVLNFSGEDTGTGRGYAYYERQEEPAPVNGSDPRDILRT